MMIMPANNLSGLCHYYAGKYPGKIGILNTPKSYKNPPYYMPYAIDNGCFVEWNEVEFYKMLTKVLILKNKPIFVVVPDVVGDAEGTFKMWHKHYRKIKNMGFDLAFACQDGLEIQDVPKAARVCFIGGSTEWKLENAHKFKGVRNHLHIGRVSTKKRMIWSEKIGADSIDGTGFFRGRGKQYDAFVDYFEGKF